MPHDHLSPSGHPYRADDDTPLSYWQTLEIAVRELLIDKGITTAAEVADQINTMDARSPANGARVVARAWTDPAYHARLMQDAVIRHVVVRNPESPDDVALVSIRDLLAPFLESVES